MGYLRNARELIECVVLMCVVYQLINNGTAVLDNYYVFIRSTFSLCLAYFVLGASVHLCIFTRCLTYSKNGIVVSWNVSKQI